MKMGANQTKQVLSSEEFSSILQGLAQQISQQEKQGEKYSIVGIHTRGVPLAQRLMELLKKDPQKLGILDINLYRDDLSTVAAMPVVKQTKIPFDVEHARILLVDDVLFTGRTIRSALDALNDLGRPHKIELAVLIDRGGRELPIQADFVGKRLEVGLDQIVDVKLVEVDGVDEVGVHQR